jgi:hypothetical protein
MCKCSPNVDRKACVAEQLFFQAAKPSDTTIAQCTTGPNRETTRTPSVKLWSWAMRNMSESVEPVEIVQPVRIGASYKKTALIW